MKIDRKNSGASSPPLCKEYNNISPKSTEQGSIAVVHESWVPADVSPLRITNSTPPAKEKHHLGITLRSPTDLHSPLASPYASPVFTPAIEVLSATTESAIVDDDTPAEDTGGSSTTAADSSISGKGIKIIDRPLSDRFSGQLLENREQPVIACDNMIKEFSQTSALFSKKDLRNRPLPPSPPIAVNDSETIQTLRAELVTKARELNDEKKKLESVIAEVRKRYEQANDPQNSSKRQSFDRASLNSRLQWVEFESNCLKIENEILNKKVSNKLYLEQELHTLKEENSQLSTNLGRLRDLNKRVVELEHQTGGLEEETGPRDNQLTIAALSPCPRESRNYRDLQEQMAQVQSDLLNNAAEQRAEWDEERSNFMDSIKELQSQKTLLASKLDKEQHKCRFFEQEYLRVEASYTALSESLKQQKSRFQHQLKAIEEKLVAIEFTDRDMSLEREVGESLQAQQDLSKGHQQLFQLQEHYMKVLERFHARIKAVPRQVAFQEIEVQDALSTLRQFLPPLASVSDE